MRGVDKRKKQDSKRKKTEKNKKETCFLFIFFCLKTRHKDFF